MVLIHNVFDWRCNGNGHSCRTLYAGPPDCRTGVFQPDDDHAWIDHGIRCGHASICGFGQLANSINDWRTGYGATSHEQLEFLDPAICRHDVD